MKAHRGKIVKNKLKELGVKINLISKKAGYSRGHFYKLLGKEDLQYHIIYEIGKILRYDFLVEFPDMPIPKIEKEINHLEVKEIKYNVNQDGINELKKKLFTT